MGEDRSRAPYALNLASNAGENFAFRLHPEKNIDHFSAFDGTVKFYGFVKAIMLKIDARNVLDFGAGRGAFMHDDPSVYRRYIRDLRTGNGATPFVTACDMDTVVLSHPCSHKQVLVKPEQSLPFEDETFDVIVSDMTFEHIKDAEFVSKELLRIVRPGGYICARTPNRFGYIRFASELVANGLHATMLSYIQPDRRADDIFPTYYRLNSVAQIRKSFPGCDVYHYYDSAEPAYYFGCRALYQIFFLIHKLAPAFLATSICFFVRKRSLYRRQL